VKTIWKFPLAVADYQLVAMPRGAEVLAVQTQNGTACIWAKVDTEKSSIGRGVWIRVTGPAIGDAERGVHAGTFQLVGGQLVCHVFVEDDKAL